MAVRAHWFPWGDDLNLSDIPLLITCNAKQLMEFLHEAVQNNVDTDFDVCILYIV